eukprot:GFUD01018059.1.p1 GENE.GFUD01018059.1~~GFUD01018059.1.p1  ORF type:complete len:278 (-),score=72.12 GFUD01018059.1:193-993(-)
MNSTLSELILTLFSIALQLYIDLRQRFKPENFDIENAGFYTNIFYPSLLCMAMLFTSIVLTLCLAVKSQLDSARRLQASNQARQSSGPRFSVQFDDEDPVNDHYASQPSTSFSDLRPSAPSRQNEADSQGFGQFLTVDRAEVGPRQQTQRESNTSEDSSYNAEDGNEDTVLSTQDSQHRRSPSLSKALARVRESIVGVNSQFECPVCFEEMKPPVNMFQCRQGHVVCQNCRNQGRLTECPSCRGSIVGRNFAMEKLAEEYFKSFDV